MKAQEDLEVLTKRHYEQHPFDAITRQDEANPRSIQPPPFLVFCDKYLKSVSQVAEIGCGPGRATMLLVQLSNFVTSVDISDESIRRAKKRAPDAQFVNASNIGLPFDDCSFDVVISDGVIHHTPDAFKSLSENARILKPGGVMYLGVYNRKGYYYYIYTYIGPVIRFLEKNVLGRYFVNSIIFPAYYLAHLIKSRGKRTWKGAKNFFL